MPPYFFVKSAGYVSFNHRFVFLPLYMKAFVIKYLFYTAFHIIFAI